MNFGAFIEFASGKEGMCHISEVEDYRVNSISDVLSVGQTVRVKVTEIDSKGRINLSIREAKNS